MTHFRQESPPLGLPPELGDYLARLEDRIRQLSERALDLHEEHVEPAKREDGMVRFADGTDWDPGQGKGLYLYTDNAWQASFFASSAETDPVFTASPVGSVTTTQVTNWDTAFGWGDHSTAGYLAAEVNDLTGTVTWANVPDANITQSSVVQHETAIDALSGDVLIDQTTAATDDGAQLRLTDTDNSLTTYTMGYVRQRNNAMQIGVKDPLGVQPDVNFVNVAMHDTDGIGNTFIQCGASGAVSLQDTGAGELANFNDTRALFQTPVEMADLFVDQNTAATDDGAQVRMSDVDNSLTTYTVGYIRQRNNAVQIGVKDPAAVQPDVNILNVAMNDTDGISNTFLQCGASGAVSLQDTSFGEMANINDTRARFTVSLQLHEDTAPPSVIADGDVVYADGTSWDPGDGEGFYGRIAGAWVFFGHTPGGTTTLTSAGGTSLVNDGTGPALANKGLTGSGGVTLTDNTTTVDIDVVNWAVTGAEDVNVDRITATAVTQHQASIDHDALTNFVAAEHIDWSVTGAEDVHVDRIAAGAVTQHETSIDALAGDVLIDQTTAATADGAQIRMTDTDNSLTTYTVGYIRQRNNAVQVGVKDPAAVQPDVNAISFAMDDTDGLGNMTIRVGSGNALVVTAVTDGNLLEANDTRVKALRPVLFDPIGTAPASPIEGMVAYANGTGWDPGSGKGLYVYKGTAWTFIA